MPNMPTVTGLELPDALNTMAAAGVRVLPFGYFQADPVLVSWVKSSTVKPGFVISQSPASGAAMAANARAILSVSIYPVSVSNYGGTGS